MEYGEAGDAGEEKKAEDEGEEEEAAVAPLVAVVAAEEEEVEEDDVCGGAAAAAGWSVFLGRWMTECELESSKRASGKGGVTVCLKATGWDCCCC